MAYFPWKDEYSVNIASIDVQHKKLVEMLNELFESMKIGQGREKAGVVLSQLVNYTRKHFADEEALLKSNDYPAFAAHLKEHISLTEQVLEYERKIKSGDTAVSIQLSNFLKNWLINHIQQIDKQYSKYLNARGIQ